MLASAEEGSSSIVPSCSFKEGEEKEGRIERFTFRRKKSSSTAPQVPSFLRGARELGRRWPKNGLSYAGAARGSGKTIFRPLAPLFHWPRKKNLAPPLQGCSSLFFPGSHGSGRPIFPTPQQYIMPELATIAGEEKKGAGRTEGRTRFWPR